MASRTGWILAVGPEEGCGGFLNPPTHPTHRMSVQEWRRGKMRSLHCVENDSPEWPEKVRAACKRILQEWKPLPPDDAATVVWRRQILGYFKGCFRNTSKPEPECWNADQLCILPPGNPEFGEGAPPLEDHAGVRWVRRWYPGWVPSTEDIANVKWGS